MCVTLTKLWLPLFTSKGVDTSQSTSPLYCIFDPFVSVSVSERRWVARRCRYCINFHQLWMLQWKNNGRWENSTRSLPQLASLYFSSHITILLTFTCRSQGDTDCELARTLQSHCSRQKITTAATQSKEKVLCCDSLDPLSRVYARDTSLKNINSPKSNTGGYKI